MIPQGHFTLLHILIIYIFFEMNCHLMECPLLCHLLFPSFSTSNYFSTLHIHLLCQFLMD